MKPHIGVIGAGKCSEEISILAEEVGREIARSGGILLCGGLGGVMEAASRGCNKEGGTVVGILPTDKPTDANDYVEVVITTSMGHGRNAIIAQSADVLIAVAGEYGTLSEIALSLAMGKKVVCLKSQWNIEGTYPVDTPEKAVEKAFSFI
ncbi:uncharacterized protein (TIGR00725 family) [Methanohalophilus levihalophilus]|uniref:TIGR00725 family protein n=1 Tax=Methanohalophilus levihalophilus TaxID=1431282 RepID=UPI001AE8DE2E|nr:TIGR00725 family protein [Methanohalophilus levihalophilus]MBP2031202.1 uncharacterized protein (TIGR00725 family) [Methanohalophilus levihalophilus]